MCPFNGIKLFHVKTNYGAMEQLQGSEVKRIGIFRALYLGDMLCIIPTVRAIRRAFPQATIYLIGLSWQRDFVKRFPTYFDDFMTFPGWPGLPEQEFDTAKILEFLNDVRKLQLDLLFQMQGNGTITNSMCLLWGARKVLGLRTSAAHAYDEKLFPVSEDTDHEVLRFLKLVDALGIPRAGEHLEFPITEEENIQFMKISSDLDLMINHYVCIHPGARDPKRRWPLDHFAYVANHLAEAGFKIVLTGSWQEEEILSDLQRKIRIPPINIVERLNEVPLGLLATIIQNSKLLVANDTGVSHIASGLQHPSVIIFSAYSELDRWAPLNRSLHRVIPADKATDPEYVLYCILDQLQKQTLKTSSLLLNQV
jgi:ADP-heptose:LPS heptosyltransferase